jgi:hypothetical protein
LRIFLQYLLSQKDAQGKNVQEITLSAGKKETRKVGKFSRAEFKWGHAHFGFDIIMLRNRLKQLIGGHQLIALEI